MIFHCLITYKEFFFSLNTYIGKFISSFPNVIHFIQNDCLTLKILNGFELFSLMVFQYNDCIL